jgi:hypothetical protein
MKKNLRLLLFLLISSGAAQAQFSPFNRVIPVSFNRGVSPTNDTTANGGSNVFYESPSNNSSVGRFFPNITDGSYRLRALCYGNGVFNLAGNVLTLQNTTTSTAIAKFTGFNINGATGVAKFKFTLDLTGFTGNNGNAIIIALGNNSGSSILTSSSNPFTTANAGVFGSFRMIKSGSDFVTQFRSADGSTQTPTNKRLITPLVSQTIEIFANNTSSPVTYRYRTTDTADSTIAANTYNVYVNGEKHVENFPKVGTLYDQQTSINAISIVLAAANGGLTENIKISNLEVTYPSTTLPVSLVSFSGKKASNGVLLNWETASELNNNYFEILRSTNGQNFNVITSVSGKGTTNQASTYSYLDQTPEIGTNYYKLNQVDLDGTSTLANQVLAVDYGLTNQQVFSASINNQTLAIHLNASSGGSATISLIDLTGKKVFSESFSVTSGINYMSFPINQLSAGIYVANLTYNGQIRNIKIIK